MGRPLGHIVSNLCYEHLVEDVQEVLNTLVPKEIAAQSTAGIWYSVRIRPYRTVDNVIEGAVITSVDISERKHAEEALCESEERYRALYEGCPDGYARVTMDGHIVESNKAFQEMVGYSTEELNKMTYQELTPKQWHERDTEIISEILKLGWGPLHQKEFRRKGGTLLRIELRGIPNKGQGSQFHRHVGSPMSSPSTRRQINTSAKRGTGNECAKRSWQSQ